MKSAIVWTTLIYSIGCLLGKLVCLGLGNYPRPKKAVSSSYDAIDAFLIAAWITLCVWALSAGEP